MNDLTALQYRLSVLESLLAESGIISPGTIDDLIANVQSKPKTVTNQPVVGTSLTAAGVPKVDSSAGGPAQGGVLGYGASTDRQRDAEVDSDTEGAALTLEHLAFGQRKTEQQVPTLLSARSYSGTGTGAMNTSPVKISSGSKNGRRTSGMLEDHLDMKLHGGNTAGYNSSSVDAAGTGFDIASVSNNKGMLSNHGSKSGRGQAYPNALNQASSTKMSGLVKSTILDSLDPAEVFSIFYQRSDVYVRALLSVIPTREKGELLVKQYLDRVEWLHRCESAIAKFVDPIQQQNTHVVSCLFIDRSSCPNIFESVSGIMGYTAGEYSARGLHAVLEPVPDHSLRECLPKFRRCTMKLTGIYSQLGLYFMDPKEALQHFTQEERDTLPEKWLNAAHGVRLETVSADPAPPILTTKTTYRACGKAISWPFTQLSIYKP